jgi:hypothetical protein
MPWTMATYLLVTVSPSMVAPRPLTCHNTHTRTRREVTAGQICVLYAQRSRAVWLTTSRRTFTRRESPSCTPAAVRAHPIHPSTPFHSPLVGHELMTRG